MRRNTAGGGSAPPENARPGLRARAQRARALAARYGGGAAAVLMEIADDLEARADALPDAAD